MTQRFDAISKLLNNPALGGDIRRAIAQSRRDACPGADDDEDEFDEVEEVEPADPQEIKRSSKKP